MVKQHEPHWKRGVNSGAADRLAVTVSVFSLFFSVFKIYTIDDDDFTEKFNLRVGRSLNLNFSASDVAWSHIEGKKISLHVEQLSTFFQNLKYETLIICFLMMKRTLNSDCQYQQNEQ